MGWSFYLGFDRDMVSLSLDMMDDVVDGHLVCRACRFGISIFWETGSFTRHVVFYFGWDTWY